MARARVCVCVSAHSPDPQSLDSHHIWPLGMGGPDTADNLVTVCPNAHRNVHELLRAWVKWDGPPPWEIRSHFGRYTRELAERGYLLWVAGGRPPRRALDGG